MTDPVAYSSASDRWLAEFLARCADEYCSSPAYRQALNRERAPMFRSHHQTPRCAA